MRTLDAFVCAAIGIGSHFYEDTMISKPAYAFFWPITKQRFGTGVLTGTPYDLIIANSEVLLVGILLLSGALFHSDACRRERVVESIPAGRNMENEMNFSKWRHWE